MRRTVLAASLLLVAVAPLAEGSPVILVTDAGGPIHSVDAATGAVSNFGSPSVIMTDIAISPAGLLYGISDDKLYRIDRGITGTVSGTTLIGNMGIGDGAPAALVFASDGTLYTANTSLYSLNVSTGAATLVGNGGYGYGSNGFTGDLAFAGGELYLTSASVDFNAGFAYEDLVKLDRTTGQGSLVGRIGSRDINTGDVTGILTVWGLVSPDGASLLGVAGTQVVAIDPLTAAATLLVANYAQPPFQFLGGAQGAAFAPVAPVPLPAAGWLLATAVSLLAARQGRSRRPAEGHSGR